jgi:esterase/lipase
VAVTSFEIKNRNGIIRGTKTSADEPGDGAIVCIHGGPGGDRRGNTGVFDEIAELGKTLNITTYQFDMFGYGDSDGKDTDITLETQFHDYHSVLELAKGEVVGPIHVCGESLGATIAAMEWAADVKSHILLWPAFDLRKTDLSPYFADYWQEKVKRENILDDTNVRLGEDYYWELFEYDFEQLFVLPNQPVFIAHGRMDQEVPFSQTLKALERSTNSAVLYAHSRADHGFKGDEERYTLLQWVQSWLEKSLPSQK